MLKVFLSSIVIFKSKKHHDLPPISTVNFKCSSKDFKNPSNKSILVTCPVHDSYHLIDVFETLNAKGLPDNALPVSFNIANMFPSINNNRDVAAVKSALGSRTNLSPSTECIIEALEICLTNKNSTFADQNFIQTNATAIGAANSSYYSYLAIQPIDNAVTDAQRTIFQEIFYFTRYRNDCITVST